MRTWRQAVVVSGALALGLGGLVSPAVASVDPSPDPIGAHGVQGQSAAQPRDIVFVRRGTFSNHGEVWRMNVDGSSPVRVLGPADTADAQAVNWSPSGRELAVVAVPHLPDRRFPDIFTAAPDGSDLRNLTRDKGNDYMPTWNPAGTKIAYVGSGTTGVWGLWVMNADGTDKHLLTDDDYTIYPSWSPDGTRIAHTCGRGVCVRRVAAPATAVRVPGTRGEGHQPEWSPDGRRLLYTQRGHIYISDVATGQRRLVRAAAPGKYLSEAKFSPDGRRIVFTFERPGSQFGDRAIAVISTDGTGFRRLTSSSSTSDTSPDWRRPR